MNCIQFYLHGKLSVYQFRWTRQCVSFTRTSLTITECSATETFNRHFNYTFYTRIFKHIILGCARLEDDIVTKKLWLLAAIALYPPIKREKNDSIIQKKKKWEMEVENKNVLE